MDVNIYTIKLGVTNCYVIRAQEAIMIEGGAPKKEKVFLKNLENFSIRPGDIRLILITHGHWDHIGSAKALKDITGAEIAMHRLEKDCLEQSLKPLPPAVTRWGAFFSRAMSIFMPRVQIEPTQVDRVLGDEEWSLIEMGIPGRVIHTPGHSPGSVSLLLETGEAFVGDLAMNGFPLRRGPGLPVFADDLDRVRAGWKTLLALGATTIHPAHGKPFPAEILKKSL